METALFVSFGLGLVLNAVSIWIASKKLEDKRINRANLGGHYARIAVAHGKQMGLAGDDLFRASCDGFIQADKALDGKRDFSDGEVALYVRAEMNS